MHFCLKMDFVICQGFKSSHLLNPRASACPLNLFSFLHKYPVIATYRRIQYLDKYSDKYGSYYLNNFEILNNQNVKKIKSRNLIQRLNTFRCNTLSKSDYSTKSQSQIEDCDKITQQNISMFEKMKQLAKKYWSVLVPIHIITSVCWVSMFYIAVKHGVDIIGILKSLHMSEKYLEMLQKSNVGDWAFTYALYKIVTPLRYTVTIGLTSGCVKYLKHIGYLKTIKKTEPVPPTFTEKFNSTSNSNISNHKNLKTPKT